MVFGDDSYIKSLFNEVMSLLGGRKKQPSRLPLSSNIIDNHGFRAPIRGNFSNSGNFSPNKATDRRHPHGHQGVDLRAPGGTSIYPIATGIVTNVGLDPRGGNIVNVLHANGVRSYYAHLGTIRVQKGDRVNFNTVLGTIGNSGNASETWPHLHLQIWKNNQLQNPAQYFNIPEFTSVNTSSERPWLSERAKQVAQSFNVREHVSNRIAINTNDQIIKKAEEYENRCLKS